MARFTILAPPVLDCPDSLGAPDFLVQPPKVDKAATVNSETTKTRGERSMVADYNGPDSVSKANVSGSVGSFELPGRSVKRAVRQVLQVAELPVRLGAIGLKLDLRGRARVRRLLRDRLGGNLHMTAVIGAAGQIRIRDQAPQLGIIAGAL